MKQIGLSLNGVQNISFIGSSIAEILIDSSMSQQFIDQAKRLGLQVNIDLNVLEKNKRNPVWIQYGSANSSLSEVIKSNFIRRISNEIKMSPNQRVRKYYWDWIVGLGWKDSLLISTPPSFEL